MLIFRTLLWTVVLLAAAVGPTEARDAPIVFTEKGLVLGLEEESAKGTTFYSYYSIPYAKPPVGPLRFRDPVPANKWKHVVDARIVPPMCIQLPFTVVATGNTTVLGQEDCLYLNVFTRYPNKEDAMIPVMVYIHGGAYFAGSSSKYPPYALMNEDIVLVVIQYRLGVMGFLSTEDSVIPGNFGLKDQTEALRWVKKNIHHFGGDPSKVTIFGESAGGASVHYQILTPKSDGLFTRAIMQSGTAMCPWSLGASHNEVARHTAERFKCPTHSNEKMLKCLQEVNADKLVLTILDYFEWMFLPLLYGPRVDGNYLPADPDVLMRDENYKKIDVMSGITANDGALHCLLLYTKDDLRKALLEDFTNIGPVAMDFGHRDHSPLPSAQTIFNYYLGGVRIDEDNADEVVKMFTDRHFGVCQDLASTFFARNDDSLKVFRYELEYRGEHSATDLFDLDIAKDWITHVDDLFYLFTGADIWQPLTEPDSLKLRDIFTKTWTNFAATGNPTPDDSLGFKWEPATEDNFHYLSLTPNPSMKPDNRKEVREFFATLPTRQNEILYRTTHPISPAIKAENNNPPSLSTNLTSRDGSFFPNLFSCVIRVIRDIFNR